MLPMLVALLTLAPLRTLIASETGLRLPLAIDEILLLLYALAWLASRVVLCKRILHFERNPTLLATLALAGVFAIGAWTSLAFGEWLKEWLKWLAIAFLIWQLAQLRGTGWRWLVVALAVAAAGNALIGLYIFFGGSGADHLQIMGRFYRAFGTFGQPNPFGGFMGIALPVVSMAAVGCLIKLYARLLAGRNLTKTQFLSASAWLAAAGLIAAGLLASWSRGAWLGIGCAALVMLVALPRKLSQGLALVVAVSILTLGLWQAGILPDALVSRLTSSLTDLVSVTDVRGVDAHSGNFAVIERLAHWQAAVDMADDYPIFGVGLGNYSARYAEYRLINWKHPLGHAHNHYLNLLAETGVVGVVAWLAYWAFMLRIAWTLRRHPDTFARCVGVGLLGCWTYLAAHSFFDYLFVNSLFLHIGVLLGAQAILHRQLFAALALE